MVVPPAPEESLPHEIQLDVQEEENIHLGQNKPSLESLLSISAGVAHTANSFNTKCITRKCRCHTIGCGNRQRRRYCIIPMCSLITLQFYSIRFRRFTAHSPWTTTRNITYTRYQLQTRNNTSIVSLKLWQFISHTNNFLTVIDTWTCIVTWTRISTCASIPRPRCNYWTCSKWIYGSYDRLVWNLSRMFSDHLVDKA